MTTDKKISPLIPGQLPAFIRDDHPEFVAFIQAYYEYLEQSNVAWNSASTFNQGKLVDRAKGSLYARDIDLTLDIFADKLYTEFLSFFPSEILANKKIILKDVKDFYRSRGTEKSFSFLFRILFGEEPEFYYPKRDILIASSGKWLVERSIRVENVYINGVLDDSLENILKFVSTKIIGSDSNAEAFVERVLISYENNVKIIELFFSNRTGDFEGGENVTATNKDGDTFEATMLAGQIVSLRIINSGSRYNVGDPLLFESNTGQGAAGYISQVSTGNVLNVLVVTGGAGFTVNDTIQFFGGGGSGANAIVGSLDGVSNSYYHANTININSDIISTFQNVVLNAANYGFTGYANSNANTLLSNALTTFVYGPMAPLTIGISGIIVTNSGNNYITVPTVDIFGNTRLKTLGILGKMRINDPGLGYANGDILTFTNIPGGYGTGANGRVASVNGSGSILRVEFANSPGFPQGGLGYSYDYPPTISISSANGTGANVSVVALLGYGNPQTQFSVNTGTIGSIISVVLTDLGRDYETSPTVNLTSFGDGNAVIIANVVSGSYTYPGRYLDDTGFLSSYNFLQDKDYYQNYSYVIKVKRSISDYKKYIKNMLHPGGLKLFGEYLIIDDSISSINVNSNSVIVTSNSRTSNAVYFDNTHIYKTTTLTGIANGKSGTFSCWINLDQIPENSNILTISNTFSIKVSNNIIISAKDTSFANNLNLVSNISGQISKDNWIHILASWNLSNAQSHIYITNVSSKNTATISNSNIRYNAANVEISRNTKLCISDVWFDTVYVDLSNVSNRHKFITANLSPASLGATGNVPTGTSPVLYLKGDSTTFVINNGTGGNFTANGTLANCNSSPTSI